LTSLMERFGQIGRDQKSQLENVRLGVLWGAV